MYQESLAFGLKQPCSQSLLGKKKRSGGSSLTCFPNALRLVFTSDAVGVGVIIRSVKRYNLVRIKQRSRSRVSDCAHDSVAYNQVKTRLSKTSEAEENGNVLIG